MSEHVIDPVTGELLEGEAAAEAAANLRAIADEFARVSAAHDEALDEAKRLGVRRDELATALRELLPVGQRADAGSSWVVMEPASRPAQRVDRNEAARYREALLGLDLGREETVYQPPTKAEIDRKRAQVIAAGVPLDAILPEPVSGPPRPVVVPKGGA